MCNINVLVKKNGSSYVNALNFASAASYSENSDADGIFLSSNNSVVKSEKKINYAKFAKEINLSNFVITHQRIATSGFNNDMNQPFFNDRFVLIHNGIITYRTMKALKSDTATFFYDFLGAFKKHNNVKKAIEVCLDKFDYGSYSIFIYDKDLKEGYYFKSTSTQINFYELKGGNLFISTSSANKVFFNVEKEIKIIPDFLYKIYIKDNTIIVEDIGELTCSLITIDTTKKSKKKSDREMFDDFWASKYWRGYDYR